MNVSCLLSCFRRKMESNFALKNKRKIIEEPTEKQEMWISIDTECWVDKKVVFTWNTIFQAFQKKGVSSLVTR
jgi:hypothetical protein